MPTVIAAAGCVPQSTYRYTALVPAARPLSWDGRTTRSGLLRLEGTAVIESIRRELAPQPHDTALYAPRATLEGAAAIAVTSGLELGARFGAPRFCGHSPKRGNARGVSDDET